MALTKISNTGLHDDAIRLDSIDDESIDEARIKISNTGSDGQFLQKQSGNTGGLTWASAITLLGGASGADYNDNVKVQFGTGDDLQIWHTGSESILRNTTATHLYIQNSGGNIDLQAEDHIYLKNYDGQTYARFIEDGASELYYDDSKKLETTSTGIYVDSTIRAGTTTGSVSGGNALIMSGSAGSRVKLCRDAAGVGNGDGLELIMGADNTTYLWNRENTDLLIGTNGLERLRVDAAGNLNLGRGAAASTEYGRNFQIHDTGTSGATLHLTNSNTGPGNSDGFHLVQQGSHLYHWLRETGDQVFATGGTERLRVKSGGDVNIVTGNLQVGGTNVINSGRALYNLESLKLADSKNLILGSGDDLQISHSSGNSLISNTTGYLVVESNAGNLFLDGNPDVNIRVGGDGGEENSVVCKQNGAVELYYDSAIKAKTTSAGIQVFGNYVCSDNHKLLIGNNEDLQIYHNGTYNTFRGANFWVTNAAADETLIYAVENGAAELWYDNVKKLETYADGVEVTGDFWIDNPTNAGKDLWFDASGNFLRAYDDVKFTCGTGDDLQIYHSGSHSYIKDTGTGDLFICSDDLHIGNAANTEDMAVFEQDGGVKLYYDNSKKFETYSNGIIVYGPEGGAGYVHVYADEGDDNADKWRLRSNTNGDFSVQNYASGDWETTLLASGNGKIELRYDNVKKLETTNTGVTVTGGIIAGGLTYPTSDGSNGQVLTTNGSGTLSFSTVSGGGGGGGATGTDYNDDVKVRFGTDNDLEIYHSGNNALIKNSTGGVFLRAPNFYFENAAGTENKAKLLDNGACELYYDNSKKFETISTGVQIYGDFQLQDAGGDTQAIYWDKSDYILKFKDNIHAEWGNGRDLQIYHNGTNSYINNATGALAITGNDLNFENAARNETYAEMDNGGAVKLYYDATKKFETWTSGARLPSDNNVLAIGAGDDLRFWHNATNSIIRNATGQLQIQSNDLRLGNYNFTETYIKALENGAVELYYDNSKKFETSSSGAEVFGHLRFGDSKYIKLGNSGDVQIFHNGSNFHVQHLTSGSTYIDSVGDHYFRNADGTEYRAKFSNNGAVDLYYDGSLRLSTASDGVHFTGGHIRGGDNNYLMVGAGQDLQIWHDGTNSSIKNNTGTFFLRGADVRVTNAAVTEHMARFYENGAVELNYDNVKKFHTNSTGVYVTGKLKVADYDSGTHFLSCGASDDLKIYHDGSHSKVVNGTGDLHLASNNAVKILGGSDLSEVQAVFIDNDKCELYYDNSKKLETSSAGGTLYGTWTGAGKVVQVVQEHRTDVFSESLSAGSKSGAALTKAITTSSASNKVLVSLYLTTSVGGTSNRFGVTLKRGGSEIALSDDTSDNKLRTSVCGNNTNNNNCDAISFSYLDSPGSAASHTYTVHLNHGSSNTQTIYLNRAGVESNNNYRMRGTSSLTLQEITA